MSVNFEAMAQRWHDTDHGPDRGKPLRRSKFIEPVIDSERASMSSCWCCCELCNPDWNPGGSNPFWARAMTVLKESV